MRTARSRRPALDVDEAIVVDERDPSGATEFVDAGPRACGHVDNLARV